MAPPPPLTTKDVTTFGVAPRRRRAPTSQATSFLSTAVLAVLVLALAAFPRLLAMPVVEPDSGSGSAAGTITTCAVATSVYTSIYASTNAAQYPLIGAAAAEFGMCTNAWFAVFAATISHETARLTIFQQPADGGAGAIHAIPANWPYIFSGLGLVYTQSEEANRRVMLDPNVMYRAAAWWFDQGAAIIFGSRCAGMKTWADQFDTSQPLNVGNNRNINNNINSCIFGGGTDPGANQRFELVNTAFQALRASGGATLQPGSSTGTPKPPSSDPPIFTQGVPSATCPAAVTTTVTVPGAARTVTVTSSVPVPTTIRVPSGPGATSTVTSTVTRTIQPTAAPATTRTITATVTRTVAGAGATATVTRTVTASASRPDATISSVETPTSPDTSRYDTTTTTPTLLPTTAPAVGLACTDAILGDMECAERGTVIQQCVWGKWVPFAVPPGTQCTVVQGEALIVHK
ncbi:hypothetical protein AMAG_00296 [Allomyces macrogynus ATCC 38327]|uniref:Uncharacterized protein n=1 Tax=Allomyces macrogynus (strain ATCC 38327) TaxID=578462 RepID=A0A0L0RW41_ALLM3|nr:hypothetical protein AMAG_00296 [Allomyces macrogynus ATCC 38327]|eukprot:KNE54315.1 hypothetical protein AMAG_00296 [Allomyces macrogynus ATCC 38327]